MNISSYIGVSGTSCVADNVDVSCVAVIAIVKTRVIAFTHS